MNAFGAIILFALLLDLILNAVADYMNLKMLQPDLPQEFQGLYDEARYRRSQAYLKVNTRFGWFVSSLNLLLLLVFWFGGGFPLLDKWVRSWYLGPVPSGMAFIGILSLLAGIVSLPFSIYATFVIEEQFGFNQTTWSTFIKDKLKALALALLLGAPLMAGVLAFFEYAGSGAWLYCWIVVTLYMLVVQFVAPTWIMPLFNRFSPLEDGPLKQTIFSYARSIDFPLDNIYVMDGSRRSSKSNAFFTGFGRHKRIVLFDTLIERHSVEELVAVLAHEMGHYKKKSHPEIVSAGRRAIRADVFSTVVFHLRARSLRSLLYAATIGVRGACFFRPALCAPRLSNGNIHAAVLSQERVRSRPFRGRHHLGTERDGNGPEEAGCP
jgi:STE24 endopeptidase